jgi:hypothetical protein
VKEGPRPSSVVKANNPMLINTHTAPAAISTGALLRQLAGMVMLSLGMVVAIELPIERSA